jgi:uncharacterized protein YkwD
MRGSIALFWCLIGCAVAAGIPAASADSQQKEEIVFVGVGKVVRRSVPDAKKAESGKPESKPNASPAKESYAGTLGEAPAGHKIDEIEGMERDCLGQVNHQRVARGLSAMAEDRELLVVARAYSRQMAEERFFSHIDRQGRDVRQRLEEAGITWRMVGENLSYSNGYINPVAITLRGWMDSPGHRHNILEGRYNDSAIGAWIASDGTVYFTQIFLRK